MLRRLPLSRIRLLFLIIFIEGYVVLASELIAIRQLIPFVGSGTETIAIIISAVLLPLAVGYHAGGKAFSRAWARREASRGAPPSVRRVLLRNVLLSLVILAFGLSYPFLEVFFGLLTAFGITNRLAQTFTYSAIFLVTPVFLLGQTVPLVSQCFPRVRLSEITGKMLFFSTAGSFLGSVFSTIVLMSLFGVHYTTIVTLGLLALLGMLLLRRIRSYEALILVLVFAFALSLNSGRFLSSLGIVSNNQYNTIAVQELPQEKARLMVVNRSASSKIAESPEKQFPYMRYIEDRFIAPLRKDGPPRDILVIGAGGFTAGLEDEKNRYVYVDIDPAMKRVAEKHFLKRPLTANKRFAAESARAFLKGHTGRYDLILLDAYTNMISLPMEATTREFLRDVKKVLKPGGAVVANVISSPDFRDRFTLRYDNTFRAVFPHASRQIIGDFNPWDEKPGSANGRGVNNVLYLYFDRPGLDDATVYSDDRNTYSLDR